VQVKTFADLSWDHNPIHLDQEYAKTTRFKRCIAHGMLVSTMFGTIMATQVPGAVYVNQTLAFKAPVFVGDAVTARFVLAVVFVTWWL
jgi:3-hydroxybutyryl-CoA dehydratase